jgi:uncharacterized membrane protein YvlD (DUF360 family)
VKTLLRNYLINLTAIWVTARILPGLDYTGGTKLLFIGAGVFMIINWLIVPLLKVMFLPLNLLTLGIFGWAVNVVGLYLLTVIVPEFKLLPFTFPGATISGIIIPAVDLSLLQVAIVASFLIGFMSHFCQWLVK